MPSPDPASLADRLNRDLPGLPLGRRMAEIATRFARPVFTTSLGLEDQAITALIAQNGRAIDLVTLQTGRLFAETLDLIATTQDRYGLTIRQIEPDPSAVDQYVATYGLNGFYDSVEARKACCAVRKVAPLARALEGADAWITGMRRNQSDNRSTIPFAQWDEARGLMKLNPLADVSTDQLQAFIAERDVPTNPLHARGYPSIGCEPCTRAIKPGEPERAGRWWWEQDSRQECGLHVANTASPTPLSASSPDTPHA